MGKTFKHVDKGKYRNKVLKYDDVCDSTKNMFERHNSDISEDKQELFRIKNKIAEKELKTELKDMENYKTIYQNKQDLNQFFSENTLQDLKSKIEPVILNIDRFTPLKNGEILEDIEGEYVLLSSVLSLFSPNKSIDNNIKINNSNFIDITDTVFREIGGSTYKLTEEKNLLPEHNVNGMILINRRFFNKTYL